MSNSYLTNAARIAGTGRDQGLTQEETADALMEFRLRKERRGARAMDGEDRRAARAFNMADAGVPAELGGFNYGNGGEDIEFGVDQADWQIAQNDDKDIEAKNRKRAIQAAADIGFDQRIREEGPGARERRAQAIMELRQDRAAAENPYGRTDYRMQNGTRIQEDPFIVGQRGRDGNLLAKPDKVQRIFAKFGRDGKVAKDKDGNPRLPQRRGLEREPAFPIGFEDPSDRNNRMRSDIRRDREAVQRMIVEDAAQFDPVIAELNNREVARQAQGLGERFNPVNDMNNIPNLRDIGNLKAKVPAKAGGFNEGQYFPVAAQDGIAPAFNASGIPLGIEPPASVNSPTGDNTLNSPRDAREWLVQNQPGYKEGGRVFGDFPQVDIMGAGDDFLARIGKIKAKGEAFDPGVSAIRNINDLEAVVQNFAGFADQGGLKMFQLDADKKEVFRDQVGLPEIFQKMKMNENGQGRLANAMFQLEIGRANGVNVPQRAAFELGDDAFNARKRFMDLKGAEPAGQVQFGARLPEFGNDEAQLQKIPRGAIEVAAGIGGNAIPRLNVGVDAVGLPIKQELMAALQGLQGNRAQPPLDANELRDARNGMVGLVQGEGRGRNYGFAKRIPEGVDPRAFFKAQAVARAKPGRGPDIARVNANADQWQRIVDREKAARTAPNEVLGVQQPGEREIREKDVMIDMDVKQRIQPQMEQAEREELKRLILEGPMRANKGPGVNDPDDGMIRVPLEIQKGMRENNGVREKLQRGKGFDFPDEVVNYRTERFMGVPNEILPVNKGIIPMKDRAGNLKNQVIGGIGRVAQAEGGGMGGGDTRPPSVVAASSPDPWQTPPATGGGFTEQSVASNQAKGQSMRDNIIYSLKQGRDNFNAAPRRQRYGAAAGAALLGATGISSLIGGERDRREQGGQY